MSKDLNYFTEFLEDPSAFSLGEFYRMVKEWANYVTAHKGEFDYLADDEWKDIRERLLAELPKREKIKEEVEAEWAELCELGENLPNLDDKVKIELLNRQLEFMKTYQGFYNFRDEDIAYFEEKIPKYIESVRKTEIAEDQVRISKQELVKSIADLDEFLVNYYERTGKIPSIPSYADKKKHKGN